MGWKVLHVCTLNVNRLCEGKVYEIKTDKLNCVKHSYILTYYNHVCIMYIGYFLAVILVKLAMPICSAMVP